MVSRQHLIRITAGRLTNPSLVINEGRQRAVKGQDIRHAGMAKTGPRGRAIYDLKLARAEMPAEALQKEGSANERHDLPDLPGRTDLQSSDHTPWRICPRSRRLLVLC